MSVHLLPSVTFTTDGQRYPVYVEVDSTDEPYRSHTAAREFVPLTVKEGIRTRVFARFYTSDADLLATQRKRPPHIGEGQAWFYQEDRILLLWRCTLLDRYRVTNPLEDQNLHILWQGFEQHLLEVFPVARQLLTPSWNRPYDERLWLQFIQQHGYTRPSPTGLTQAAFIKDVVIGKA